MIIKIVITAALTKYPAHWAVVSVMYEIVSLNFEEIQRVYYAS